MATLKNSLALAIAAALVMAGPAALGAWFARPAAPVVALPPVLALGVAGQVPPGAAEGPIRSPGVATLFGRGAVTVERDGQKFDLGREAYAYPGGESINIAPGSLGVLRLPGSGSIFLCGGATATVNRTSGGALRLVLDKGAARVVFGPGAAPGIDAGGTVVGRSADAPDNAPFAAEVLLSDGQVLVLPLLAVMTSESGVKDADSGGDWRASPANHALWRMSGGSARSVPLPGALEPDRFLDGSPPDASTGGDYLCQLPELAQAAAPPDGSPPDGAPPSQGVILPGSDRLVQAPPAPGLAIAEPGDNDAFDPDLLPAPAAGPGGAGDGANVDAAGDAASDPAQLVVAAPALPVLGTGGAGLASPD